MKILSCRGLKKQIGELSLGEIEFELEPGYILGVIGVNGAGKSTLLKCLMGGVKLPESTEVVIDGCLMQDTPKEAKSRMAFVLTDCPFSMGLTAEENMKLFSPLYQNFKPEEFERWMSHFELSPKQPLYKLSKGQQVKFQLAFALSYDAKLYFMDEPSANLDVEFREEFYRIMRELISDGTKSVIYVTQLIEELEGLADYILWLDKGRQLLFMDMEELQERFVIVSGLKRSISSIPKQLLVGDKYSESHNEALIDEWQGKLMLPLSRRRAGLEEILYYFEKNPAAIRYFLIEHNEKKQQKHTYV